MNKAIPHDSAKLHVTGEARYVDDIPLPAKTLHLAFGLSSIAKGQIKSIDLSAVREAPGVVDIIPQKTFLLEMMSLQMHMTNLC